MNIDNNDLMICEEIIICKYCHMDFDNMNDAITHENTHVNSITSLPLIQPLHTITTIPILISPISHPTILNTSPLINNTTTYHTYHNNIFNSISKFSKNLCTKCNKKYPNTLQTPLTHCYRCGRNGHKAKFCYQKTHIKGYIL